MLSNLLFLLRNLNRPPATGAVDPATLNDTLLNEASYAGAPWAGTASTGTSGSHSLTAVSLSSAPTLTSLNYSLGDVDGGGASVVATGTNCATVTSVTILGVSVTPTSTTSTTVTFPLPSHAGAIVGTVALVGPGGTSGTLPFEYWSPLQITGVDAYFDANKGVTTSGLFVTQWVDQSANGVILTQASGSTNQPSRIGSVFGALPSIRWDGTNRFLENTSGVRVLGSGQSMFVIGRTAANVTTQGNVSDAPMTIVGDYTSSTEWNEFGMHGGSVCLEPYNNAGTIRYEQLSTSGNNLIDGSPHIFGFTQSNASPSIVTLYIDGVAVSNSGSSPADYPTTHMGWRNVGRGFSNVADEYNGDIGAIVIVNGVISSGDRAKLHAWASQRFIDTFSLLYTLPDLLFEPGNFINPSYGVAGAKWTATVGTDFTDNIGELAAPIDGPGPICHGGVPDFQSGDGRLGSASPLSDWATSAGDVHQCVVFTPQSITTTNTLANVWENQSPFDNDGGDLGFALRVTGGVYYLDYWQWDTTARIATVSLGTTLGSRIVAQGKRSGGFVWVRVGLGTWIQGDAMGAFDSVANDTNAGGSGYGAADYIGKVHAIAAWKRALSSTESDNVATLGATIDTTKPTFTSLNYKYGDVLGGGQSIVATGTNLSGATVTLDGVTCTIVGTTSTTVTFTLPANAAAGLKTLVITTGAGSTTLPNAFEYFDPTSIFDLYGDGTAYASGTLTVRKGQNLVEATNPPAVGSGARQLNGRNTIDFDGVNDLLHTTTAVVEDYATTTTWFSFVLFNADVIDTNNLDPLQYENDALWSDDGGWIGLHLYGTTPALQVYTSSGGSDIDDPITISTGAWIGGMGKHDTGKLYSRLGSGAWSAGTTCGTTGNGSDPLAAANLRIGSNYGTQFFDGRLAVLGIAKTIPTEANITKLIGVINQQWGTTL